MGEYRVKQLLGKGGFGSVYKAVQPLIGKAVAVKVLSREFSDSAEMVSRFVAEARAVNRIRHRNIVDIFSFGRLEDGRHYFVMELLEGSTLRELLAERGRLPLAEAITILRGVARALDAAHANGIAHRDLKPDNIFLVLDGEGGMFPKLIDFGIAKLLDAPRPGAHVTQTGAPIGTPRYMSPEQIHGTDVDQRTDIYSLGVVTHEILTGKPPFHAEAVVTLCLQHLSSPAPAVSSVCPDLPTVLDAAVLQMLEKSPEGRPRSASSAIEALAVAAASAGFPVPTPVASVSPASDAGPPTPISSHERARLGTAETVGATPVSTPFRDRPSSRRRRVAASIIALAFLVGVCSWLIWTRPSVSGSAHRTASSNASAQPPPRPSDLQAEPDRKPSSPAARDEVEIELRTSPVPADIYLDGAKLGSSAQSVRLPRGSAKLKLTLKADGYLPAEVEVVPSQSRLITARLTKQAPRVPSKKKHSAELENPF